MGGQWPGHTPQRPCHARTGAALARCSPSNCRQWRRLTRNAHSFEPACRSHEHLRAPSPFGRSVVTSAQWSLCREELKRGEFIRPRSPERSSLIPCACALSPSTSPLALAPGPASLSLSPSLSALLRKESCFRGRCCPGGRGAAGKVTPPTTTPRHSLLFCVVFFSVWRAPFSSYV